MVPLRGTCRSWLASEGLQRAAFDQAKCVIVNVLRWQASSYRVLRQGLSRQPWRSLIHTARLLRPMPLTITRLLALSSVKPLKASHCFT